MTHSKPSFKTAILSIALLCTHSMLLCADQSQQTVTVQSIIDKNTLIELQARFQQQSDIIEAVLNTLGQHNSTKASSATKSLAQMQLTELGKSADQIKRFAGVHIDEAQLHYMITINGEFIAVLDKAIQSDLTTIPSFDLDAVVDQSLPAHEINEEVIRIALNNNDKKLLTLVKNSEKIGLSVFNTLYRSTRKFCKNYYVADITEHVVVYSLFFAWLIYVTSAGKIEMLPTNAQSKWWVGRKLDGAKQWVLSLKKPSALEVVGADGNIQKVMVAPTIGGTPSASTVTVEIPANVVSLTSNEAIVESVGSHNPLCRTLVMPLDGETLKPLDPRDITSDINKGKITVQSNHILRQAHPAGTITSSMPNSSDDHSIINRLLGFLGGGIVNVSHGQMFSLGIAPLFGTYIKNDAQKIYGYWLKNKAKLDDLCFGTTGKKSSSDGLTVSNRRFKDIVGREDVKAELTRVVEFMCDPDRFQRAGIKVDRGILLAGLPQTGKTMIAEAFAGEIKDRFEKNGIKQPVRMFEICTENLTKFGIQYWMDKAKEAAPCVLFLDELDLLRLQRDGDSKTLSEFLTAMSGTLNNNEKDLVVVLAATNKPENIDFALRQHGRFGKIFWFDNPTFKHRIEFFIKECEKRCMNIDRLDLIAIAQQTEGCSFGTLDIVIKNALLYAKLENAPVVQAHFEKSINLNVKHLVPHGYTVPAEKEQIVAVRQSGKALTSLLLRPAKQLCTVTVLPVTQDVEEKHVTQQYSFGSETKPKERKAVVLGGIFAYHLSDALGIESENEIIKQCKILLASNAAQRVFGLDSCATDKTDKQEAFNLVKQLVFDGLDAQEMAKAIREEKLVEAYKLLEKYEKEVEALLTKHKDELKTIVTALQSRKTLSAGDIKELLNWTTTKVATA